MKKNTINILLFILLLLNTSCRKALKDVNDYFPKIILVSATVQADGSVLLTTDVESKGGSEIEYLGFCYSSIHSSPIMLDNQISLAAGSTFSTAIPGLSADSVYYFRAWAANSFGYSYSNVLSLDSIIAPVVTPPCTLVANKVDVGDGFQRSITSVSVPTSSSGTISFIATASTSLNFIFGSTITTGIYTTTGTPAPSSGEVYVGLSGTALSNGSKVYVNTISPGVYDMTICNAPWSSNGTNFVLNSNCIVPH